MRDARRRLSGLPIVIVVSILAIGLLQEVNVTVGKEDDSRHAEDRQAVETAINNVFGWAINKDFDLFFNTIADDSEFISVTPYKRVKFGVADVKKDTAFWGNPDFRAIRHELRNLRITFSRSGDVAWFFCMLDDINEIKGEPANWENVRWTGVVERRDGKWRVVQQHFSYAQQ